MVRTKSRKPSKQRKALYNAPTHVRRKRLTAKLSPELREKYGVKRLVVRTNDLVRIVRGDMAGHEGKVLKVDYQSLTLHIDGVTMKKADGTPVFRPVQPSNVMLIKLDLSDKERRKIIERRRGKIVEEEEEEKEKELSKETEEAVPTEPEGGMTPEKEAEEEVEVNKEESKSERGAEENG